MKFRSYTLFLLLPLWLVSCRDEQSDNLSVSTDQLILSKEGGSATFELQTDAPSWTLDTPADWISIPVRSGTEKKVEIKLTVLTRSLTLRSDTLVVRAGNARPVQIVVVQEPSDNLFTLTSNRAYFNFSNLAGSLPIQVTSDASVWTVHCDADWVRLDRQTGTTGTSTVQVTVTANPSSEARTANLVLQATDAADLIVPINQKAAYPNYNTDPLVPDATGMSSTAVQIASRIKVGWNAGNTLEAIGGETAWGNPMIDDALIKLVKKSGFQAIRLPCSWNQYANQETAEISAAWLNRVKQVVQLCVDNGLYVVLNIHWDGGWLENNCTLAKQDANKAKQRAFWQQIATKMRNFDEHLLFASANEPNVADATQMGVLLSYHQTFVDAVRATGGKNAYRVLVIQGPSTDITMTNNLMTKMPTDGIANKLMAEIHYYTPWNFSGMTKDESWGKMAYYWGKDYHSTADAAHNSTWGEEETVVNYFNLMKSKFVDKGIPVLIGEFGAVRRDNLTGDALTLHLASRAYYLKYCTKMANILGLIPFYWDSGGLNNLASGIFDRPNDKVYDEQSLNGLIQGSTE